MLIRVQMILITLLLATPVVASQSITHTQEIKLDGRSLDEVMLLARERAMDYAMEELPALVMGQERLNNENYSRVIESWQLAGLRHEFLSTSISHNTSVAVLTSVIHYDKDAVVQALVEVSSAKRLTREAGQLHDSIREIEADTLSEHFLQSANAAYESAQNQTYSDNDERLINIRLAQERVLAEAMKDVYIHYITPAIKSLRTSTISVGTGQTSLRDSDGNLRKTTILAYSPLLAPVEGSNPNSQGVITWDIELNTILEPYQERYPFINIGTIIDRMSVCSSTGDVLINGNANFERGYHQNSSFGSRSYSDGYNTNLRYLRPTYDPDTMRREQTTLVIANYGNIGGRDSSMSRFIRSIADEHRRAFEHKFGHRKNDDRVADYYYHKNGESIGVCIH